MQRDLSFEDSISRTGRRPVQKVKTSIQTIFESCAVKIQFRIRYLTLTNVHILKLKNICNTLN